MRSLQQIGKEAQRIQDEALVLETAARSRLETIKNAVAEAEAAVKKASEAKNEVVNSKQPAANSAYELAEDSYRRAFALLVGTGGGSALDEWKEARISIGRFDTLIVDLRKTGIGFMVAIVSTAAVILSRPDLAEHLTATAPVIYTMLALVILVVYLVDLAHGIWLDVAVERAIFLEKAMGLDLTQSISRKSSPCAARWLRCGVYIAFAVLAAVPFWFAAGGILAWQGNEWIFGPLGAVSLIVFVLAFRR